MITAFKVVAKAWADKFANSHGLEDCMLEAEEAGAAVTQW